MRLIDADALIEDMKTLWDYETVDGITSSTVLKQIVTDIQNAPTIAAPRWVRCEADRPQNRQECFVAHKGPSDFIYEHAVYYDDLNEGLGEEQFEDYTDGFVLDGDVGYAFGSIDYWMPIEPPKEG